MAYGTYKNYTSKIFVLPNKAIRAINNLAYNEHKWCNYNKYKYKYISISFKFRTSFFNYYTPILMKK